MNQNKSMQKGRCFRQHIRNMKTNMNNQQESKQIDGRIKMFPTEYREHEDELLA